MKILIFILVTTLCAPYFVAWMWVVNYILNKSSNIWQDITHLWFIGIVLLVGQFLTIQAWRLGIKCDLRTDVIAVASVLAALVGTGIGYYFWR